MIEIKVGQVWVGPIQDNIEVPYKIRILPNNEYEIVQQMRRTNGSVGWEVGRKDTLGRDNWLVAYGWKLDEVSRVCDTLSKYFPEDYIDQ